MTRRWVTAGSAVSVALLLVCTAWAWAWPQEEAPVSQSELCDAYLSFAYASLDPSPRGQTYRRRTAAELATLAVRYPPAESPPWLQVGSTFARIERLLTVPYATSSDLMVAAIPVAAECGLDWRRASHQRVVPELVH